MIHLQSITSQKNFSKVIQHFSPNWFISVHIARVTYLYSSFEIWLIIHNVTFGLSNSLSPCTPLLICMPTMGWPRVELPTSTRFARWGNSSTRSARWFSISAFSVYLCRGQLAPHTTQSDGWNMNDNNSNSQKRRNVYLITCLPGVLVKKPYRTPSTVVLFPTWSLGTALEMQLPRIQIWNLTDLSLTRTYT